MIVPDFMMLAAACAPAVHPTTLSAIVMQESRGHIYAIGVNGNYELLQQPSSFNEAVATAEQLKKDGHNFDMGLGQINVKNLKLLGMSLSDLFDPCKNLKVVQTILTHCYKQEMSKYSSEQAALQAALSCYNTRNSNSDFTTISVQEISSHVIVKVPALVSNDLQETLQLHTERPEHVIETESLLPSSEESVDAFMHKESRVSDAFTTEEPSSLER